MKSKDAIIKQIRDSSILIAWICGILFFGILIWSLTSSLRADFLMNSINQALISMNDRRRLEAAINPLPRRPFTSRSYLSSWFSIAGEEDIFIFFTLIADGVFLPCGAIAGSDGRVKELIPISSRGQRILNNISPGILRLYIRRIEGEL